MTGDFYINGTFDFIFDAWTFVALFFNNPSVKPILQVIFLFGVIFSGFSGMAGPLSGGRLDPFRVAKTVIIGGLLYNALISTSGTIRLIDNLTNEVQDIPNIPNGLVAIASTINNVSMGLEGEIEAMIGAGVSRKDLAYGTGVNLLRESGHEGVLMGILKSMIPQGVLVTLDNYTDDCLALVAAHDSSVEGQLKSTASQFDAWDLGANNALFVDNYIVDADTVSNTPTFESCYDTWEKTKDWLQNNSNPEFSDSITQFCKQVSIGAASLAGTETACRNTALRMFNEFITVPTPMASENDISRNAILSQRWNAYVSNLNDSAQMGKIAAYAKTQTQLTSIALVSQEWMPVVKNIYLMLTIALAPILLIFLMTDVWMESLKFLIGMFVFWGIWVAVDCMIECFWIKQMYDVFEAASISQNGTSTYDELWQLGSKSLAMLGSMRTFAMLLASSISFGVFRFGGSAMGQMASRMFSHTSIGAGTAAEYLGPTGEGIMRQRNLELQGASAGQFFAMNNRAGIVSGHGVSDNLNLATNAGVAQGVVEHAGSFGNAVKAMTAGQLLNQAATYGAGAAYMGGNASFGEAVEAGAFSARERIEKGNAMANAVQNYARTHDISTGQAMKEMYQNTSQEQVAGMMAIGAAYEQAVTANAIPAGTTMPQFLQMVANADKGSAAGQALGKLLAGHGHNMSPLEVSQMQSFAQVDLAAQNWEQTMKQAGMGGPISSAAISRINAATAELAGAYQAAEVAAVQNGFTGREAYGQRMMDFGQKAAGMAAMMLDGNVLEGKNPNTDPELKQFMGNMGKIPGFAAAMNSLLSSQTFTLSKGQKQAANVLNSMGATAARADSKNQIASSWNATEGKFTAQDVTSSARQDQTTGSRFSSGNSGQLGAGYQFAVAGMDGKTQQFRTAGAVEMDGQTMSGTFQPIRSDGSLGDAVKGSFTFAGAANENLAATIASGAAMQTPLNAVAQNLEYQAPVSSSFATGQGRQIPISYKDPATGRNASGTVTLGGGATVNNGLANGVLFTDQNGIQAKADVAFKNSDVASRLAMGDYSTENPIPVSSIQRKDLGNTHIGPNRGKGQGDVIPLTGDGQMQVAHAALQNKEVRNAVIAAYHGNGEPLRKLLDENSSAGDAARNYRDSVRGSAAMGDKNDTRAAQNFADSYSKNLNVTLLQTNSYASGTGSQENVHIKGGVGESENTKAGGGSRVLESTKSGSSTTHATKSDNPSGGDNITTNHTGGTVTDSSKWNSLENAKNLLKQIGIGGGKTVDTTNRATSANQLAFDMAKQHLLAIYGSTNDPNERMLRADAYISSMNDKGKNFDDIVHGRPGSTAAASILWGEDSRQRPGMLGDEPLGPVSVWLQNEQQAAQATMNAVADSIERLVPFANLNLLNESFFNTGRFDDETEKMGALTPHKLPETSTLTAKDTEMSGDY